LALGRPVPPAAWEPALRTVSELLRPRQGTLWHVRPEDSVFDALRLLAEHEVGALMVMDQGRLVGILSERDYTRKVALAGRNSRETRVADIMTSQVLWVAPATTTEGCMALMSAKKVRHLPVINAGTVLGMVSMRDLVDDIIAEQASTIAHLENYLRS
jgi:signal-transduction protein with cAMP-binding, CBS, and nucleotidyltransferase domain